MGSHRLALGVLFMDESTGGSAMWPGQFQPSLCAYVDTHAHMRVKQSDSASGAWLWPQEFICWGFLLLSFELLSLRRCSAYFSNLKRASLMKLVLITIQYFVKLSLFSKKSSK